MVDGLIFRSPGNFAAPVFRPPGGSRYISLKVGTSQVASTILEQLGGTRRLQAMVGAHSFADHGNGVSFLFPNRQRSRGNSVKITLTPADTYDMDFYNVSIRGAKKVKSYPDIYFDQLQPIFEKQTGLYLRLGAQKTSYSIPPANQAEWVRIFDSLRAGQTVQLAMKAVMSIGGLFDGEYHDYKVQRRSVSKKYGVESLTLQPIGRPKSTRGSRIKLMKRGGKVSAAVGDMAADLHGIKRASQASAKAVAARFLDS